MNTLPIARSRAAQAPAFALAAVLLLCACAPAVAGPADSLPPHILVGYWHNFVNEAGSLRLSGVPPAYDVVNVAFAVSAPDGSTMQFAPDPGIYPNSADFTRDVAALRSQGKKVFISVGGANSIVQLKTDADVQNFVSSMTAIINAYGFDGVDVDLEAASVSLNTGDTDFRNPTTPVIINLIKALRQLVAAFPNGLLLSMAPETAYVQGGYPAYAGIFGAYLPIINALRDILTFIQVQHYNTGEMNGRDGNGYMPGTADFHVAMADMLLAGFKVNAYRETSSLYFPPLEPRQVLIGLPASAPAASSGYTPPATVIAALNYLMKGVSYGGSYVLSKPAGYPGFRGLMTWSINWDVKSLLSWSSVYRKFFDTVVVTSVPQRTEAGPGPPADFRLEQNYPNPFNPSTTMTVRWPVESRVRLAVYDVLGREVAVLLEGLYPAGTYRVTFNASRLASGVYVSRLTAVPAARSASAGIGFAQSRTMVLTK